jgi:hypothetical protein
VYDKLDWHLDGAVAAGQPEENGFVHIGFYLAWMIRHDLHDPLWFPPEHVAAVKAGEMSGSDLADDIDTKLGADEMSPEGSAFSDACYARYLEAYAQAFAHVPDYGVVDEPANEARAAEEIDRLYAGWVADGRPAPAGQADDESDRAAAVPAIGGSAIDTVTLGAMTPDEVRAYVEHAIEQRSGVVLRPPGPGGAAE